jgi:signal transduction histidine kinase
MTDNFRNAGRGREDGLSNEVEELRVSRRRLVVAADADRRTIERDLHNGVQQHLVALSVGLQLADQAVDGDPATAKALLAELQRDVQHALDETTQLAQRIYPPLLDAGGLAAALRAAAVSSGVRVSLDARAEPSYPPEIAGAIYWCCLAVLERAERATVTVRDEQGTVGFDVVADGDHLDAAEGMRDRVEALGGRLTIRAEPGGDTRVSGSFPLS